MTIRRTVARISKWDVFFFYCVVACCSVLQCVAVCCSVLQCAAVCCSVLQCVAANEYMRRDLDT